MAKQEKVTPPEITEELLASALEKYREEQRIELLARTAYHQKSSNDKYANVAKALSNLERYWLRLSPEEIEAFFLFVNPAHEKGANLLLGDPIHQGVYGLGHDLENAPGQVQAKIRASLAAYERYREDRAGRGGVIGHRAYTQLLLFLMRYWERTTGKPVTFSRDYTGESPKGITLWLRECFTRLAEMGAAGLDVAPLESRAVEVYKHFLLQRSES